MGVSIDRFDFEALNIRRASIINTTTSFQYNDLTLIQQLHFLQRKIPCPRILRGYGQFSFPGDAFDTSYKKFAVTILESGKHPFSEQMFFVSFPKGIRSIGLQASFFALWILQLNLFLMKMISHEMLYYIKGQKRSLFKSH